MIKKWGGLGWLGVTVIKAYYSGISRINYLVLVKEAGFVSLFQEKGRTLDNYGGGLQLFVPLHQLGPHEKYL